METINRIYATTVASDLDVTYHELMGKELEPNEVISENSYSLYCSEEARRKLYFLEGKRFPELEAAVKSVILYNRVCGDVTTARGKLYYKGREKADYEGYIDTPFISYKTSDFKPAENGYQFLCNHRCFMDYSMPW